MTQSVIDDLKRSQILELLEQGKRIDGRAFDESRKLVVEVNAIPKAKYNSCIALHLRYANMHCAFACCNHWSNSSHNGTESVRAYR